MSRRKTGGVLVLGIGNTLKGDDAVGPYVAAQLRTSVPEPGGGRRAPVIAIDCGTVPENYTSIVRKMQPDCLVLVDAADMSLDPGCVRIIPKERAGALALSTHGMPLSLFIDYVRGLCGEVMLVGIQPRGMSLGDGLSAPARAAADWLLNVIREGRLSRVPLLGKSSFGDDEVR